MLNQSKNGVMLKCRAFPWIDNGSFFVDGGVALIVSKIELSISASVFVQKLLLAIYVMMVIIDDMFYKLNKSQLNALIHWFEKSIRASGVLIMCS